MGLCHCLGWSDCQFCRRGWRLLGGRCWVLDRDIGLADPFHWYCRVWCGPLTKRPYAPVVWLAAGELPAWSFYFPRVDRSYTQRSDAANRRCLADGRMRALAQEGDATSTARARQRSVKNRRAQCIANLRPGLKLGTARVDCHNDLDGNIDSALSRLRRGISQRRDAPVGRLILCESGPREYSNSRETAHWVVSTSASHFA